MRYYNPSRGPLPLSLPRGQSASVPGRSTIDLTPEQVGSESVQAALMARQLWALPDTTAALPAEEPVSESAACELRFPGVSYDPPVPPPPPLVAELVVASGDAAEEVTRG